MITQLPGLGFGSGAGLVATARRALESARRTAAELNPEVLGLEGAIR
jgi:hypothetical protein